MILLAFRHGLQAIRLLLHFARVAQWVRRARMLVMQENRKLRSNGLTLRCNRLFEEMILYVLRQVAPYPNNSLTERAGELFFGDWRGGMLAAPAIARHPAARTDPIESDSRRSVITPCGQRALSRRRPPEIQPQQIAARVQRQGTLNLRHDHEGGDAGAVTAITLASLQLGAAAP
jgi:hypothetical protein